MEKSVELVRDLDAIDRNDEELTTQSRMSQGEEKTKFIPVRCESSSREEVSPAGICSISPCAKEKDTIHTPDTKAMTQQDPDVLLAKKRRLMSSVDDDSRRAISSEDETVDGDGDDDVNLFGSTNNFIKLEGGNNSGSRENESGLNLLLEAMLRYDPEPSINQSEENVGSGTSHPKRKRKLTDEICKQHGLSATDERWFMMLQALEDFGEQYGHCNVPISYECEAPDGSIVKLGTWLSTQRQLKRKVSLRREREALLQALVNEGLLQWVMPSIASPDDEKWSAVLESLIQFGNKFGHCNVPYGRDSTLEDGTNIRLGAWLRKQRELMKTGSLRADREARLQALVDKGMLKLPPSQTTAKDQWNAAVLLIKSYYDPVNGAVKVPLNVEVTLPDNTGFRLGGWLRKQSELRKKGQLSEEQEAELQTLVDEGLIVWDVSAEDLPDGDKWDVLYEALVRYADEHGNCNLSSCQEHHLYDGTVVRLGAWLSQQRHLKKKGKLREEREMKLQALVNAGKLHWVARAP